MPAVYNTWMKKPILAFVFFALFLHAAAAGTEPSFPEQVVFRSLYAGVFTVHTALIFTGPYIHESNAGWYIYYYNSWLCHQLPDRSFYLDSYPMPVCARCMGINVGKVLGASVFPFRDARGELGRESLNDSLGSILLHGLMMTPLAVDGLVQKYTDYESNNLLRVTTGLLYGYGITMVMDEIVWILGASIRSISD